MQNRGSHHGFYWVVMMIMHTLARQINSLTHVTTTIKLIDSNYHMYTKGTTLINIPSCIKMTLHYMQIRGSHLGCERLVMVILCKSWPRTMSRLLLFKLVKLPPKSGIYHLFTLQNNMPSYASICK